MTEYLHLSSGEALVIIYDSGAIIFYVNDEGIIKRVPAEEASVST